MNSGPYIAHALRLKRTGRSYTGSCPCCGYRGFTVEHSNGKVLVYCHAGGCSQGDVIAHLKNLGLWERPERAPENRATARGFSDFAQTLWERSSPAEGTLVETYLRYRRIINTIPKSLRFLARGKHTESGLTLPMMMAAVTLHDGPSVIGIHRTYLAPDGTSKADVTPNKKSLGPIKGGAVWLAPLAETVCVAEGIETALSCLQATGIATAAALSAGGMEQLRLPPLPLAGKVIIAADHDERGLRAAEVAAHRWHAEGRRVHISKPKKPGTDFNDDLRSED
ncbi:MAG: toprim domain-containing protein [Rhodospirillaceae bacterium]